jgi:hypothetical protein
MRTGRPKAELVLSEEERAALERYARRGTVAQQLGLRAGISAVWPLLSLALMSAPLSSSAHTVGASPRDAALIESKVGDCDTQSCDSVHFAHYFPLAIDRIGDNRIP